MTAIDGVFCLISGKTYQVSYYLIGSPGVGITVFYASIMKGIPNYCQSERLKLGILAMAAV